MKKNSLILLVCFWTSYCSAQVRECILVKDTFCLVTLDIRGNGVNPILMSGVTNNSNIANLKTENVSSLLSSFYEDAYFVPDISNGLSKMIVACMGDSAGYKYLKDHNLELAQLPGRIKNNIRSKNFKLQSGEVVFLSVTTIGGSFWKVNKSYPGISKSSNEEDISTIKQIEECYVPFEIDYMKKPKKIK